MKRYVPHRVVKVVRRGSKQPPNPPGPPRTHRTAPRPPTRRAPIVDTNLVCGACGSRTRVRLWTDTSPNFAVPCESCGTPMPIGP